MVARMACCVKPCAKAALGAVLCRHLELPHNLPTMGVLRQKPLCLCHFSVLWSLFVCLSGHSVHLFHAHVGLLVESWGVGFDANLILHDVPSNWEHSVSFGTAICLGVQNLDLHLSSWPRSDCNCSLLPSLFSNNVHTATESSSSCDGSLAENEGLLNDELKVY